MINMWYQQKSSLRNKGNDRVIMVSDNQDVFSHHKVLLFQGVETIT